MAIMKIRGKIYEKVAETEPPLVMDVWRNGNHYIIMTKLRRVILQYELIDKSQIYEPYKGRVM